MNSGNFIKKKIVSKVISRTLLHFFLTASGLVMTIPFLWMISTSFKPFAEIFVFPIIWIPKAPTLNNYEQVFAVSEYVNFFRGFGNTLLVVVPTMFCGVFMSALAAFGYSRINFPGRDRIFFAYIATMAIPGIITLVPNYIIFTKIGLLDSRLSLMLPGMFGSASAVFFIRQFMRGLPKDLDDAARVDGMNWFGIFLKILLPLSKPVIITILLFSFIGGYNDYMAPLLYIRSADKYTLQLTLSAMNDTFGTRWGVVMAGSCIAMIPTIIIFFLAQRFFIEGISLTGIKE